MRRLFVLTVAGALTQLLACAAPPSDKPAEGSARRRLTISAGVASRPATPHTAPAAPATQPGEAVLLRTALLPSPRTQTFSIDLRERRETELPDATRSTHDFDVHISGSIAVQSKAVRGEHPVVLRFQVIRLRLSGEGAGAVDLRYNSAVDRPGQGNALADMMAIVAGAEVVLRVSPTGRLREINGLDTCWHKAGLPVAPPALLPVQWQWRDLAMGELLAEALFPPMPGSPIRVGDRFETEVPANVPMLARLNSRLRGELIELDSNNEGLPVARLAVEGNIVSAPETLGGAPASLRHKVLSAEHTMRLLVDWNANALNQTAERSVELEFEMQAFAGGQPQRMKLKQKRILESRRGEIHLATPASRPAEKATSGKARWAARR